MTDNSVRGFHKMRGLDGAADWHVKADAYVSAMPVDPFKNHSSPSPGATWTTFNCSMG